MYKLLLACQLVVLLTFALLLLTACGGSPTASTQSVTSGLFDGVNRVVDDQAGVVCYTYKYVGSQASVAISCLPLSQTKLDK